MKVKLGGQWWSIRLIPPAEMRERWGENNWGYCHPDTRTIYLRRGQSRRNLIDTAIHEACHAADERLLHERVDRIAAAGAAVVEALIRGGELMP